MSTRSQIIVSGQTSKGSNKIITLYRHCDGYPTAVLPELLVSLREVVEGLEDFRIEGGRVEQSRRAKKFVAEKDMIPQWDIEWSYVIDLANKTIQVYAGDFETDSIGGYKNGMVDPTEYCKKLYPEYQADERETILNAVSDLTSQGWKVNPV